MDENIFKGYLTVEERVSLAEDMRIENEFERLWTMYEMVDLKLQQMFRDAELKVLTESGTYDDLQFLYEEAQEEANEQKEGILSKIWAFIKGIFKGISDSWNKSFSKVKGKENEDVEADSGLVKVVNELKKISVAKVATIGGAITVVGDILLLNFTNTGKKVKVKIKTFMETQAWIKSICDKLGEWESKLKGIFGKGKEGESAAPAEAGDTEEKKENWFLGKVSKACEFLKKVGDAICHVIDNIGNYASNTINKIKGVDERTILIDGTDYKISKDDKGNITITSIPHGSKDAADPSKWTPYQLKTGDQATDLDKRLQKYVDQLNKGETDENKDDKGDANGDGKPDAQGGNNGGNPPAAPQNGNPPATPQNGNAGTPPATPQNGNTGNPPATPQNGDGGNGGNPIQNDNPVETISGKKKNHKYYFYADGRVYSQEGNNPMVPVLPDNNDWKNANQKVKNVAKQDWVNVMTTRNKIAEQNNVQESAGDDVTIDLSYIREGLEPGWDVRIVNDECIELFNVTEGFDPDSMLDEIVTGIFEGVDVEPSDVDSIVNSLIMEMHDEEIDSDETKQSDVTESDEDEIPDTVGDGNGDEPEPEPEDLLKEEAARRASIFGTSVEEEIQESTDDSIDDILSLLDEL